jgi:hypothetical protein
MTKTFLITYDLKRPGQNYSDLYDAIKSEGDWQHPLESIWAVKTGISVSAGTLYERLRPLIDENDSLFIVEITDQDRQGWLAKSFWTWLKENKK